MKIAVRLFKITHEISAEFEIGIFTIAGNGFVKFGFNACGGVEIPVAAGHEGDAVILGGVREQGVQHFGSCGGG